MAEQNYWFYGLLHTFWSQKPGILVWDVIFPLWGKKKEKTRRNNTDIQSVFLRSIKYCCLF